MGTSPESRLLDAIARIGELTTDRALRGIGHDDADDVAGTIESDDAIGFDPMPLLRSFDDCGVTVVVIGQVAGILHGSSELTGDLDLLWSGRPSEAEAMRDAFAAAGSVLTDDDGNPLANDLAAFELPKVTFRAATAAGDCCTPALPWGTLDVEAYLGRAETTIVDAVKVHYLTRADLIAMRVAVGREKDLRRVAELEQLPPRS